MGTQLADQISILASLGWLLLAAVTGAIGGAAGGIKVGGEHLGNDLAAMLGSFYGVIVAIPAAALGFIVLAIL